MATMKDVARRAKVSVTTVSATLSGITPVSPELKQRVLTAIDELGYHRNSIASGLKSGRTSLIGLIVPDITNPFFTEFVEDVQRHAIEHGQTCLLGISDADSKREKSLLRHMRSNQVAGTILCPTGGAQDYQTLGADCGPMKLVVANNAIPGMAFDTIMLDNFQAALIATQHLLSFGHQRVAIVNGPLVQEPAKQRQNGFQQAMADAGLTVLESYIEHGDFREHTGYMAGQKLLAHIDRPTAIFVANNQMLIGVMRAIADSSLAVPVDISVASIDDFSWASAFRPALTTVRQPLAAMAETAFSVLQERIAGKGGEPHHALFQPELVIRQSCASPS